MYWPDSREKTPSSAVAPIRIASYEDLMTLFSSFSFPSSPCSFLLCRSASDGRFAIGDRVIQKMRAIRGAKGKKKR